MKNVTQLKSLAALTIAALALLTSPSAQAGPGPQELYHPVTSLKQAESLRVGDRIAVSCGNCGGITTLTVDEGRSYLKGFTCPMCKRKFHPVLPGGGGRAVGQFSYVDDENEFSRLSVLKH